MMAGAINEKYRVKSNKIIFVLIFNYDNFKFRNLPPKREIFRGGIVGKKSNYLKIDNKDSVGVASDPTVLRRLIDVTRRPIRVMLLKL